MQAFYGNEESYQKKEEEKEGKFHPHCLNMCKKGEERG
jgi:hypothetical protein